MAEKKEPDSKIKDALDELLKSDPKLLKDTGNKRFPWEKPTEKERANDWEKYSKEHEKYMKGFEESKRSAFEGLAKDLRRKGVKINADKLEGAISSANDAAGVGGDPVAILAKSLGIKEEDLREDMKNRGFVTRTSNGAKGGKAGELWGEYREKYSIEFPKIGEPMMPHYKFPVEGRLMEKSPLEDLSKQKKLGDINLEKLLSSNDFKKPEGVMPASFEAGSSVPFNGGSKFRTV